MNFEYKQPVSKVKEKTEAGLDDAWYTRFENLAEFQAYEYLVGDDKKRSFQKERFLSGDIENPHLDYPELEKFDFDSKERELLQLKKEILQKESNDVVAKAYRWKLNEKIAELRMLRASKNCNDRRFLRYSKFIYGEPDAEIFSYTMDKFFSEIEKAENSSDIHIAGAASRLRKSIDIDTKEMLKSSLSPSEIGIPKVKITKENEEYSADEIKIVFENALQQRNVSGWDVIIDKDGRFSAINVSQEQKTVWVPEKRTLKETKLAALIEHEIGTHVFRRENGERSKLRLLGLGLDRSEKGEEGVATYQEQKIAGGSDFAGFDGHLAISLACGMDGKKRNFREVFEILRDYYFVTKAKGGSINDAWDKAMNSAWSRCVRTFRGTSCGERGVCFTKDIVYREGNIGVWNVIRSSPDEERRFSVGKYDPENPRHVWILEQLGISDEDLETLDK